MKKSFLIYIVTIMFAVQIAASAAEPVFENFEKEYTVLSEAEQEPDEALEPTEEPEEDTDDVIESGMGNASDKNEDDLKEEITEENIEDNTNNDTNDIIENDIIEEQPNKANAVENNIALQAEDTSGTGGLPELGYRVLNYHFEDNDKSMNDGSFFGVYNQETKSWEKTGKLNYDAFPKLIGVKEAVMAGDYDLAKVLFKEYYVEKMQNFNISAPSDSPKADDLRSKVLAEQGFYNTNTDVIDIVKVSDKESVVEINILDYVNRNKEKDSQTLGFVLLGMRKDGSSAEFYSREAEEKEKDR